MELTQTELQNERGILKSENTLRDLCNNIEQNDIYIIGVPEGKERKKGPEKLFEGIVAENFSNLGKKTDIRSRKPREFQTR